MSSSYLESVFLNLHERRVVMSRGCCRREGLQEIERGTLGGQNRACGAS